MNHCHTCGADRAFYSQQLKRWTCPACVDMELSAQGAAISKLRAKNSRMRGELKAIKSQPFLFEVKA